MRFGKLSGRFEESFFEKMLDPMDSREAATIIERVTKTSEIGN